MTPPLVLLHPLGSDTEFWQPIRPLLGDGEIVALDLSGHGHGSGLPQGAGVEALAESVIAELDARGIASADMVGVSLGGLVAQYLAAHTPERVERLILVDTVTVYPEALREMWSGRSTSVRASGTESIVDATLATWFTPEFIAADGEAVQRTRSTVRNMPAEAYARACEVLAGVDLSAELDAISRPTLVVCGSDDGPAFIGGANQLAERIPGARLEWIEGKHAAILEHPERFARLVNEFRARDATSAPLVTHVHETEGGA